MLVFVKILQAKINHRKRSGYLLKASTELYERSRQATERQVKNFEKLYKARNICYEHDNKYKAEMKNERYY